MSDELMARPETDVALAHHRVVEEADWGAGDLGITIQTIAEEKAGGDVAT